MIFKTALDIKRLSKGEIEVLDRFSLTHQSKMKERKSQIVWSTVERQIVALYIVKRKRLEKI